MKRLLWIAAVIANQAAGAYFLLTEQWALAWLVGFGGYFVLTEGKALARKAADDTLTEHIRLWFGVTGKGPMVKIRRVLLLATLIWMAVHFTTIGWV